MAARSERVEDFDHRYVTVEVWHPGCWTLESTRNIDGGILGYQTTSMPDTDRQVGYYTVYGDSRSTVTTLIETIRYSETVHSVTEIANRPAIAPVSRDIVVETDSSGGLRRAFRQRGYLHLGPTDHRSGKERRTLLTVRPRQDIMADLAALTSTHEAEVTVRKIGTLSGTSSSKQIHDNSTLSVRQREAFELARERGYFEYPRRITASELAKELNITKSTFLEHLHKAENKILGSIHLY